MLSFTATPIIKKSAKAATPYPVGTSPPQERVRTILRAPAPRYSPEDKWAMKGSYAAQISPNMPHLVTKVSFAKSPGDDRIPVISGGVSSSKTATPAVTTPPPPPAAVTPPQVRARTMLRAPTTQPRYSPEDKWGLKGSYSAQIRPTMPHLVQAVPFSSSAQDERIPIVGGSSSLPASPTLPAPTDHSKPGRVNSGPSPRVPKNSVKRSVAAPEPEKFVKKWDEVDTTSHYHNSSSSTSVHQPNPNNILFESTSTPGISPKARPSYASVAASISASVPQDDCRTMPASRSAWVSMSPSKFSAVPTTRTGQSSPPPTPNASTDITVVHAPGPAPNMRFSSSSKSLSSAVADNQAVGATTPVSPSDFVSAVATGPTSPSVSATGPSSPHSRRKVDGTHGQTTTHETSAIRSLRVVAPPSIPIASSSRSAHSSSGSIVPAPQLTNPFSELPEPVLQPRHVVDTVADRSSEAISNSALSSVSRISLPGGNLLLSVSSTPQPRAEVALPAVYRERYLSPRSPVVPKVHWLVAACPQAGNGVFSAPSSTETVARGHQRGICGPNVFVSSNSLVPKKAAVVPKLHWLVAACPPGGNGVFSAPTSPEPITRGHQQGIPSRSVSVSTVPPLSTAGPEQANASHHRTTSGVRKTVPRQPPLTPRRYLAAICPPGGNGVFSPPSSPCTSPRRRLWGFPVAPAAIITSDLPPSPSSLVPDLVRPGSSGSSSDNHSGPSSPIPAVAAYYLPILPPLPKSHTPGRIINARAPVTEFVTRIPVATRKIDWIDGVIDVTSPRASPNLSVSHSGSSLASPIRPTKQGPASPRTRTQVPARKSSPVVPAPKPPRTPRVSISELWKTPMTPSPATCAIPSPYTKVAVPVPVTLTAKVRVPTRAPGFLRAQITPTGKGKGPACSPVPRSPVPVPGLVRVRVPMAPRAPLPGTTKVPTNVPATKCAKIGPQIRQSQATQFPFQRGVSGSTQRRT